MLSARPSVVLVGWRSFGMRPGDLKKGFRGLHPALGMLSLRSYTTVDTENPAGP